MFDQYNSLDEIYQFIDGLAETYPDKVEVFTIGESFEGRPLKVLKILSSDDNPVVFIESNIHAREWITSATTLWMINEFLETIDAQIRETVDSITWYILPVMNPDGF